MSEPTREAEGRDGVEPDGVGNRISQFFIHHTVLIVLCLITVGLLAAVQIIRVSASMRQEAALNHAASYSGVIREFRTLYTSEVVVRTRGRIKATIPCAGSGFQRKRRAGSDCRI